MYAWKLLLCVLNSPTRSYNSRKLKHLYVEKAASLASVLSIHWEFAYVQGEELLWVELNRSDGGAGGRDGGTVRGWRRGERRDSVR